LPSELANCRPYFERELEIMQPRAILALGSIAMRVYLGILKRDGKVQSFAPYAFGHGVSYSFGGDAPTLFASYHPSQQNTFTGKLTEKMLEDVLLKIRGLLETGNAGGRFRRKRAG
jgi:uracil-DNA glycosylase family 4